MADKPDRLCPALSSMSAVLFGAVRDGGHTQRAQTELAACLASGALLFVPCDAGGEESEACARAGIRMTPTLIAGGERVPGAPFKEVVALTVAPEGLGRRLASRGAELFGRDSCAWTRRQKAVLGAGGLPLVSYVDCEDGGAGAARCAALGVQAVPAWGLEGGSLLLPGYRSFAGLQELCSKDSKALGAAQASKAAGSRG
jgi:hypothetical protein